MNFDSEKYNFELYKDLYYHELELKEKISTRTSFAFGLLSIIIGSFIFCYNKYILYFNTPILIIFTISMVSFLISIGICVFFLFKSYYGYSYDYLPSASKIHESLPEFYNYYYENKEYFDSVDKHEEDVINNAIEMNLNKIFRESATKNRKENLRKSKYLRWFSWALLVSFIVLVINLGVITYGDIKIMNNKDNNNINIALEGSEYSNGYRR